MTDLILYNAKVITLDSKLTKGELVAMKNGKIFAVSRNERIKDFRNKHTRVIDCKYKTVLPGFIDAHCHLRSFAESLVTLNLDPQNDNNSISDIKSKIRILAQKLEPGTWIRGRGYDEFYFAERRHPTRWDLDEVAPTYPVKLTHRSGHAHVLNSTALGLIGISKETADPPGGIIDRDLESGEPTGLLYEMGDFLSKLIPRLDVQELETGIKKANQELLSLGVTSVQDASSRNGIEQWNMFRSWKQKGILKPRTNMMLGIKAFEKREDHDFSMHIDQNQLRLHGVKIILDETTGQLYPPQSELNEIVLKIHQSGFQVAIHAIEEGAVESACSAIEYAVRKLPRSDHRHRIEHCSVCTPSLSNRLASLGIMVVTQPSFLYYNGDRYLQTVSDIQLKHLYPIATLMENGVQVAGSSDCPIVPANPLIGIYSAVCRMSESGKVVLAKEGIPPSESLRMYTYYAAKAAFEEKIKGSITPGKLADLAVLSGDPTKVHSEEIKNIQVEMTILNGNVVWDKIS